MIPYKYPLMRRTAAFMRLLGYSERSIRDITRVSRSEIVRHSFLLGFPLTLDERKSGEGEGGGACDML